jgi:colicin import membrane protein
MTIEPVQNDFLTNIGTDFVALDHNHVPIARARTFEGIQKASPGAHAYWQDPKVAGTAKAATAVGDDPELLKKQMELQKAREVDAARIADEKAKQAELDKAAAEQKAKDDEAAKQQALGEAKADKTVDDAKAEAAKTAGGSDADKAKTVADAGTQAAKAAGKNALDHDGNGKKGGSKTGEQSTAKKGAAKKASAKS